MRTPILGLFLALATASNASAQAPFVLPIDQAASNFNWTGTSSLGPIVGNPSTAFQMAGQSAVELVTTPGSFTITAIAFDGGDAFTVPDLHGRIDNPFPFLPPLATIDLLGMHVTVAAPQTAVDAQGNFTATVTVTATAGSLVVTPLIGSQSTTPLAGNSSAPAPQAGTIAYSGGSLHLVIPINNLFNFTHPGSGTSGSITVTGTLHAQSGAPRSYAVYYRDPLVLGGCPAASSFNVTQTGQVTWLP